MNVAPCKDCVERYEACHDHCEKYKEWKAELNAIRSKIAEQKFIEQTKIRITTDGVRRMKTKSKSRTKKY